LQRLQQHCSAAQACRLLLFVLQLLLLRWLELS
jgi:hypothetical protein